LNYQNNYVERSNTVARIINFFAVLLIIFDDPTKSFSDLYPAKF